MTAVIAVLVFAAATVVASLSLPIGTLRAPGSGLFPLLLGILLAVLSAAQGVSVYRARLRQPQPSIRSEAPAAPWFTEGTRRVLLFLGAVALAIALLPMIGYALTSFLMMLAMLRIVGGASWLTSGSISIATAIACYLVFVRALHIPLPTGLVGF
jgi:putative tricarboxylic transport membrane protein